MKADKKIDRRVKYTKMVLRQSLLELMEKKPISKITVKEICEIADINRGTFYSHYEDCYDLLAKIEDELLSEISDVLMVAAVSKPMSEDDSNELIINLMKCIKDNSDICMVLLGENGDRNFLKKLIYSTYNSSAKNWRESLASKDDCTAWYIYIYTAEGAIGIIRNWILNGTKESYEEIAGLIKKLMYNGVGSFFQV